MKVALTPAFVLHNRPYRESSLLIDLFSRDHGRVSLVARGAKRKNSPRFGLLQPYQYLMVAWSGKSDLMTLTDVEQGKRPYSLVKRRLISGFYLNELLTRLLHQGDPHADLFDVYDLTLAELGSTDSNESLAIRLFEKKILEEIGYGLTLDVDVDTGRVLSPGFNYYYRADKGASYQRPENTDYIEVSGDMLIALKNEQFEDENLLRECKIFMRYLLQKHIGNKPLASRELYRSYMHNYLST